MSSSARRARNAVFVAFVGSGFGFASWASRIPQIRDAVQATPSELGLILLAIAATARAVPIRVTSTPASGSATSEPSATASSTSPRVDGDACRASRTCGIRDAQLAKPKPLPMKAT